MVFGDRLCFQFFEDSMHLQLESGNHKISSGDKPSCLDSAVWPECDGRPLWPIKFTSCRLQLHGNDNVKCNGLVGVPHAQLYVGNIRQ